MFRVFLKYLTRREKFYVFSLTLAMNLVSPSGRTQVIPAPKGGGSIGVGGGGDALQEAGKGLKFLDSVERKGFVPSNLEVWPSLDQQLTAIHVRHPGLSNVFRGIFEGRGPLWFFASGELKNIPDEELPKLHNSLSLGYKLEQAAVYKDGEIIINQRVWNALESDADRLYLLFHEALRANLDGHLSSQVKANDLRKLTALLMHPNIAEIDQETVWTHLLLNTKKCLPLSRAGTLDEILRNFSNASHDATGWDLPIQKTNGGLSVYEILILDPAYKFKAKEFEINILKERNTLISFMSRFRNLEGFLEANLGRHLAPNETLHITYSNYFFKKPHYSLTVLLVFNSTSQDEVSVNQDFQLIEFEIDRESEKYRARATPILKLPNFTSLQTAYQSKSKILLSFVPTKEFSLKRDWSSILPEYLEEILRSESGK